MITKLKSLFKLPKLSCRNQRRWESFKQWLPVVTRKWHNKDSQERLKWQRQNLESEFKRNEKLTNELLTRLRQSATITPYQTGRPPFDVRVELTVDSYLLQRAMYDLGRSATTQEQRDIARHLASHLAYLIERELATVNLATVGHYQQMYRDMNERYFPQWRRVDLDDMGRPYPATKRDE